MSQELIRYRAVVNNPIDPGFLYAISFGDNAFREIPCGCCPMPYFRDDLAMSFFTGEPPEKICVVCGRNIGVSTCENYKFIIAGSVQTPTNVAFVGGYIDVVRNEIAKELGSRFNGFRFINQALPKNGGYDVESEFFRYSDEKNAKRGWHYSEFTILDARSELVSLLGQTDPPDCPKCYESLSQRCVECNSPLAWSECPNCPDVWISSFSAIDQDRQGKAYSTYQPHSLCSWNGDDVVWLENAKIGVTGEVLEYIITRGWYPCYYVPVEIETDGATDDQIALAKSKSRVIPLLPRPESDFDDVAYSKKMDWLKNEDPEFFSILMLGIPFGILDAPPEKVMEVFAKFKIRPERLAELMDKYRNLGNP
jgi:hypothetical protein